MEARLLGSACRDASAWGEGGKEKAEAAPTVSSAEAAAPRVQDATPPPRRHTRRTIYTKRDEWRAQHSGEAPGPRSEC